MTTQARTATTPPVARTIAESESHWPARPGAGKNRPNVVVILVDDMGFSDLGCFGSEIPTPAIDALAATGARFTNFHVTPLCSPTRASLMTGANHHRVGYAFVANTDPGMANRSARFPDDCLTLPEILRGEGYATLAVGKWHLAPETELHDAGDRGMWPCQRGFDRYYGFLEALTTPHAPHRLIEDNSPVDVDRYPDGYYLTDDLTDHAIEMIESVRAGDPEKPFFLYVAHAAVHGPLQAKAEDIARFRDTYDEGWSVTARRRWERQVELGLFDAATPQADRDAGPEVPDWDGLPAGDRELYARMMAVYAAMVRSVDDSTARILAALDDLGERENTIVVVMSDNGATAEGGPTGTQQYFKAPPLLPHDDEDVGLALDEVGGPRSAMHYPSAWAMVSNTPLRRYKASVHEGGVRAPLVVSGPGIADGGAVCRNYQYVTDLLPTVLDLAGIDLPAERGGRAAMPIDGASFAAAVRDPTRPGSRTAQLEEVVGHRSYYEDGWKAVTQHTRGVDFSDDHWELYRLDRDPAETDDVSAAEPERVARLQAAWEAAAEAGNVFPLDEGSGLSTVIRNPDEERMQRPLTLRQGTPTVERHRASMLTTNRSFDIDIDVEFDCDQGVLVAHGGQGGGYAVVVEDGAVRLEWNDFGIPHVSAAIALAPGRQTVRVLVTVGAGRDCRAVLEASGATVAIDGLHAFLAFSPLEGIDVGIDRRSPVSWEMHTRHGAFPYSGLIHAVRYVPGAVAPDAPVHRIDQMRANAARYQ
ncbi:sulfatase-like hydrolase/transferase [Microbacterium sp.]|uniref:sulfatase-like hydrolase/transferase n=1 Tax=Microbacterium sp. TaxID=51671 RepID=UPI003A864658